MKIVEVPKTRFSAVENKLSSSIRDLEIGDLGNVIEAPGKYISWAEVI